MCRATAGILLMFLGSVFAGPNQNAKLFIDFVPGSLSIDSVGGCPLDSTITAAVRVEGASRLYGYQFYLKHDTASVRFVSGKAGSDQYATMLEKNNGTVFFNAKRSIHDSTRILVGGSLLDNDASQCVSDSGLLCLLSFKHLKNDTTRISLDSLILLDCDEITDNGLRCFSGTIIPSAGVATIKHRTIRPGSGAKIYVRNGTLDIDFGSTTNYTLIAMNTLGKQIGTNRGSADKVRFDCRQAARLTHQPAGLTVVRVQWQGNEIAVPVLR